MKTSSDKCRQCVANESSPQFLGNFSLRFMKVVWQHKLLSYISQFTKQCDRDLGLLRQRHSIAGAYFSLSCSVKFKFKLAVVYVTRQIDRCESTDKYMELVHLAYGWHASVWLIVLLHGLPLVSQLIKSALEHS